MSGDPPVAYNVGREVATFRGIHQLIWQSGSALNTSCDKQALGHTLLTTSAE